MYIYFENVTHPVIFSPRVTLSARIYTSAPASGTTAQGSSRTATLCTECNVRIWQPRYLLIVWRERQHWSRMAESCGFRQINMATIPPY